MQSRKGCRVHSWRDEQVGTGTGLANTRRPDYSLPPPPSTSLRPRKRLNRNCLVSDPSFLRFNKDSKLAKALLARMEHSAYTQLGNISRKDLGNILSSEVVQYELRGLAGARTIKEIADRITAPTHSCRGIFAILTLMKQISQIFGFVNQTFPAIPVHQDCGMSDYDLPLVMMYDESKSKILLRREDYPEAHLDCFDEFSTEEVMAFEQWQWSVIDEEYFRILVSDGPKSRCERWHYNYNANDQLPVVKPMRHPNSAWRQFMTDKGISKFGSNSQVCLCTLTDPTRSRPVPDGAGNIYPKSQLVAVRESRNCKNFLTERRAGSLISAVSHPHIVPLLFSYSHLKEFYLVFPWATSNVGEYWEENKLYLRHRSSMEYSLVLWVAEQCEGLADALRHLHRFVSTSEEDNNTVVPIHHGDIKPENILVFCSPHRQPVLKLADFGRASNNTEFHHDGPRTNADHGAGDYTAPEVYFGEPVSSKSDVWSLCCVFLDFIEWIMPSQSAPGQPRRVLTHCEEEEEYVQGREAFRDWRRSRVEGGSEGVTGYFFDTSTGELSLWIDTWLRDAQDNALCSSWMCNFVGYLDEVVLQQDADNRITSRALYGGLLKLRKSCQHPVYGRKFAIEPVN